MAAFTVQDVQEKIEGGICEQTFKLFGDSNDTLDLTDYLDGRTVVQIPLAFDDTGSDSVTATINNSTDVVTVDASGGTTDHVYFLNVKSVRY